MSPSVVELWRAATEHAELVAEVLTQEIAFWEMALPPGDANPAAD